MCHSSANQPVNVPGTTHVGLQCKRVAAPGADLVSHFLRVQFRPGEANHHEGAGLAEAPSDPRADAPASSGYKHCFAREIKGSRKVGYCHGVSDSPVRVRSLPTSLL